METVKLVSDLKLHNNKCPISVLTSEIGIERTSMKTATEAYKDKRIEMGAGNEAIVPNDFFKARKIHRNLDHLD